MYYGNSWTYSGVYKKVRKEQREKWKSKESV